MQDPENWGSAGHTPVPVCAVPPRVPSPGLQGAGGGGVLASLLVGFKVDACRAWEKGCPVRMWQAAQAWCWDGDRMLARDSGP